MAIRLYTQIASRNKQFGKWVHELRPALSKLLYEFLVEI